MFLNEGDQGLPAFLMIDSALRAALAAPGRHAVNAFSESLDLLRFPRARIEGEIVALLEKKYAAIHVDAVVTQGPATLEIAEAYRARLWPDARILYQGTPDEVLRKLKLSPSTVGLPVQHDIVGTARLALTLRPATRRLIVVHGSGDFDRTMGAVARTQLEAIAKEVPVVYLTDASVAEFSRRIAALDRDDTVVFLVLGRDADGRTFVSRDVLKQFAEISPAPIFGLFETYLGHGAVAGMPYSFEAAGRRMGELVHQVLAAPGAVHPAVPPLRSTCIADAREVERFDISESGLPAGCEVRFRQPSLWHDYRWYVVGTLLVVALQSAMLAAILWQRRARHRAEIEVAHRRAELIRSSRLALAGELTASIAHEINQPLGAILANAGAAESMLRRGTATDAGLLQILGDIRKDDLRASEIISRVRGLISGQGTKSERTELNDIVVSVAALLRAEALRREVAVESVLAPAPLEVLADRLQLEQVLVNLCVNAMDAMADSPVDRRRLVLRTRRLNPGRVAVDVIDQGPGFDAEQLPRLFESFFTTKTHGMGLGLSIARSIVEAHGGTLDAENRVEGGAMFSFDLPVRGDDPPIETAAPILATSDVPA